MKSEVFLPNLISQRPDTKWKFHCVTNVTFFVFLLGGVPLGCIQQSIPPSLLRNPLVECFVSDCELKPYQENLCMFRVLSYELNGSVDLQQNSDKLTQMFLSATRKDGTSFPVHEDDIHILEELTERSIQVYTIFIDDQSEIYVENLLVDPA